DTTGDEWDELLKDSQTEPDKAKPESAAEKSDEAPVSRVEFDALKNAMSKKDTDEGIAAAVDHIQEGNDALKGMPKRAVKSYLYGLADEKPAILSAFGDRHQNPKAWEKAQVLIGKEMAKDFADMPDADLTAGVQAAANAVRGVSNTSPAKDAELSNAQYSAMSDAEFEEQKRKELAART
ncbi:hypothetical protein LCGC14_2605340, partial [marine sediment metagenome]